MDVDVDVVARARALAVQRAVEGGRDDLADDAAIVITELVTNAVLHGGGCTDVDVRPDAAGLRIEVRDRSRARPVLGRPSEENMTGRGMRIVSMLAAGWGADLEAGGKVVWAEVTGTGATAPDDIDEDELLAMWADADGPGDDVRFRVELGNVPTDLLLAAKAHVDNVAREFALASAGARSGMTAAVPPHLATLLQAVVDRFAEARLAIKHQALAAARSGTPTTRLTLELPAGAADAAEEYVRALDELDAYSRARRLLTFETPPQHRIFRRWYIGELVTQLRAAAAGETPPATQMFEHRLLAELDRLASAQRTADRAARLYTVAAALATAATPEDVADAVLNEGVAALGASGGGMLLAGEADTLTLPGAVGYDAAVVARLEAESRDAELPAAVALRTGEAVWLESQGEIETRFPDLADLEADTVALCAVPLQVQERRLGALRFSFGAAQLFDEDARRFVLTLAAQTAQALDRAQIQRARADTSRRLQRSLLPPRLPPIPGLDAAAIYHSFGDGLEVGGDFYDLWPLGEGAWGVAIGDAAGTGPEAAGLTAFVRSTLRALAMTDRTPSRIVARLNDALRSVAGENDDRFCTAIFGVVTSEQGARLRLAAGGHPPVFVRRAAGHVEAIVVGGTLLGVLDDPEVGSCDIVLHPGDSAVLLTDGVLEARRDGQMFDSAGVERVLSKAVHSAAAVTADLEKAVLRHTGGMLSDDMAAVVLHVPDA